MKNEESAKVECLLFTHRIHYPGQNIDKTGLDSEQIVLMYEI